MIIRTHDPDPKGYSFRQRLLISFCKASVTVDITALTQFNVSRVKHTIKLTLKKYLISQEMPRSAPPLRLHVIEGGALNVLSNFGLFGEHSKQKRSLIISRLPAKLLSC